MQLSEIGFKECWNTEEDNILEDFYIKALSNAKEYHRATYTFSSNLLVVAAQGIDGLINSDGDMKLIFGDDLSSEDYDAIIEGKKLQTYKEKCLENLRDTLKAASQDKLYSHRAEVLCWMIGSKKLEMKFALMKNKKLFHPKLGIIYGSNNERMVFKGSGNETQGGLDLNWETFDVYKSWDKDIYKKYGKATEDWFKKSWELNNSSTFTTFKIPSEELETIFLTSLKNRISSVSFKPAQKELEISKEQKIDLKPKIPTEIDGKPFNIRKYQKEALNAWQKNNFKGILEHATGSGKTITAIYGITKIFEDFQRGTLVTIIGVPYQILADQWEEECKHFNIRPIVCYGDSKKWISQARNILIESEISSVKKLIVFIVVNKSLKSKNFSDITDLIKLKQYKTIFIGDECHEYSSVVNENLLPKTDRKLGLSATPFDERTDTKTITKNNNLKNYFGEVVDEFDLGKALARKYLCKYEYHPIFVHLSEDEEDEYLKLSRQIAAAISRDDSSKKTGDETGLDILYGKRSRLLGSTEEKFIKFKKLVKSIKDPNYTLVFSGDGKNEDIDQNETKDKERILKILQENRWDAAEFTAEINNKIRKVRINDFKDKTINALVAIKVLDQGVNIPSIKTAIILASSRSKRQYIQRLGRVLRKSENKKIAYIYDFIVFPNLKASNDSEALSNLIRNEKVRFDEFAKNAQNKNTLNKVFENYLNSTGFYI